MRIKDWLFKYFPLMIFVSGVLISIPGVFFTNVMAERWKRSLLEGAIAAAENTIEVLYDEASLMANTISNDYFVVKPLFERRSEELCVALTRYQSVYSKDQHFKSISVYDENLKSVFCTAFSEAGVDQLPELSFLKSGSPTVTSISVDEGRVHVFAAVPLTAFGDLIGALRVCLDLEHSLKSLFPESRAITKQDFEVLRGRPDRSKGSKVEDSGGEDAFVKSVGGANLSQVFEGKELSVFKGNSLFLFLPLRNAMDQVVAVYAIKLDANEFVKAKNLLVSLQIFMTLVLSLIFALVSRKIGRSVGARIEAIKRWIERL